MASITLNKPSGGSLTISPEDNTNVDVVTIPAGGVGKVLNVYRAFDDVRSTFSSVSLGYYLIPSLAVTLTPTSVNSKFVISLRVFGEAAGHDGHNFSMALFRTENAVNTNVNGGNTTGAQTFQSVLVTAGSDYYNNDQASTPQTWDTTTMDSPATTNEITYTVAMAAQGDVYTFALNGCLNDGSNNAYERGSSEIIIMEVAG